MDLRRWKRLRPLSPASSASVGKQVSMHPPRSRLDDSTSIDVKAKNWDGSAKMNRCLTSCRLLCRALQNSRIQMSSERPALCTWLNSVRSHLSENATIQASGMLSSVKLRELAICGQFENRAGSTGFQYGA